MNKYIVLIKSNTGPDGPIWARVYSAASETHAVELAEADSESGIPIAVSGYIDPSGYTGSLVVVEDTSNPRYVVKSEVYRG